MSTVRTSNKTAVIGGGAAGMMAAIKAAEQGAQVSLFEKNEKLGKKIYITGKGRCNFTNACETDEFLKHVPRNGRFLYHALHVFSPADMMRFLENAGCPVKTERGRRCFPASDKASDVTKALKKQMDALGVHVFLNREVTGVRYPTEQSGFILDFTDGGREYADRLIIAAGGLSYPSTGSTGDGYRFAKDAGHTLSPCFPSLTGLDTSEAWSRELQGLSLKNVMLTVKKQKKKLFSNQGEMLFTHYGISGPLVLEASSVVSGTDLQDTMIFIDMKPAVTCEKLDADMFSRMQANGKKQAVSVISELLPHRMAEPFLRAVCGIDPIRSCAQLSSSERRKITDALKSIPLTPVSLRSFDEAIITRGGISVREIDPSTMESRLVPHLYFAGEMIDVDAFTGGYNLQIAFATGALAGMSAGRQET